MALIETWVAQDLQKPVKVKYLDGNIFSADNQGNLVGVEVTNNGSPATLSGSISGSIIRSDGATVAATGSFSGNRASIVLPQDAYLVPGVVSIIIKDTVGSQITTLAVIVANVYQSSTDTIVDPGTILPSIATLIAAIDAAVASIPADYSDLWTSLAPEFSTGTAYTVGQYVTYDGGLYRFITDHAAGSWSSSDVISAKLGNDIADLKSDLIALANSKKEYTNVTVETEKAVNQDNGSVVTLIGYTTWAVSPLYRIPLNTIKIETNFNNGKNASATFGFAVYNAKMEYIIGGKETTDLVINDTYAYIRMTDYNANSDHTGLYVKFTVGEAAQSIPVLYSPTLLNWVENELVSKSTIFLLGETLTTVATVDSTGYAKKNVGSGAIIYYHRETKTIDTTKTSDTDVPIATKAGFTVGIGLDTLKGANNGKYCACFGDSITWYDGNVYNWGKFQGETAVGFESYLRSVANLNVYNFGISGATAPQISAHVRETGLSTFSYMTLTSGANDERHNTPLGVVLEAGSTFDTTTYCGAMQAAIEYALAQNPEMKIILCTPIQGWIYADGYASDYPTHPESGDIDPKWADALKRIASVYALPVCDWYSESGINLSTRNVYINDPEPPTNTQYSLHPTPKGYERMSEILIDTFRKVMPV